MYRNTTKSTKLSTKMNQSKKTSGGWVINVLVAMVISLVMNFYYFVFLVLWNKDANYARPPKHHAMDNTMFISIEFIYYFIIALVLITIFTFRAKNEERENIAFLKRLGLATVAIFIGYFISPRLTPRGDVALMIFAPHRIDPMIILKCSFTLIVTALYGKIYKLIYQKQNIQLENERLKNENLQSRYNVLVSQINPHFFFNSLNSLSMLVREDKKKSALVYIDRLSNTFRYIIQSGQNSISTLRDELAFLDSYKYLFEVRYEGKLFFDITIQDENILDKCLLSLSLQPLVENAVKHNTITHSKPMTISIYAEDSYLVVANPVVPKLNNQEQGTGIGLSNLSHRYVLMTGKDIVVSKKESIFIVKLPLSDCSEGIITDAE